MGTVRYVCPFSLVPACECLQMNPTAAFSVPKGLKAWAGEFRKRCRMGLPNSMGAWRRKVEVALSPCNPPEQGTCMWGAGCAGAAGEGLPVIQSL